MTKDHSAYEELTKEYEDSLTCEDGDYGSALESANMTTLELTEDEAKELSCDNDVVAVEENIDISLNYSEKLETSETSENNSKTDKNKTNDGKTSINKTDNSEINENKTNEGTTGNIKSSENASSSDKSGEKVNCDDTEHWNLKIINVENADDLYETSNTSGESGSSNSGESAEDDEETISSSSDTIKVAIIDSGVDYIDQVEVAERINLIPDEVEDPAYVKVRAYKTTKTGKTIYSKWSTIQIMERYGAEYEYSDE